MGVCRYGLSLFVRERERLILTAESFEILQALPYGMGSYNVHI